MTSTANYQRRHSLWKTYTKQYNVDVQTYLSQVNRLDKFKTLNIMSQANTTPDIYNFFLINRETSCLTGFELRASSAHSQYAQQIRKSILIYEFNHISLPDLIIKPKPLLYNLLNLLSHKHVHVARNDKDYLFHKHFLMTKDSHQKLLSMKWAHQLKETLVNMALPRYYGDKGICVEIKPHIMAFSYDTDYLPDNKLTEYVSCCDSLLAFVEEASKPD